jgi:hypothetical protein
MLATKTLAKYLRRISKLYSLNLIITLSRVTTLSGFRYITILRLLWTGGFAFLKASHELINTMRPVVGRTCISPSGLHAHENFSIPPLGFAKDMHEPSTKSSSSAKGNNGASSLMRGISAAPLCD